MSRMKLFLTALIVALGVPSNPARAAEAARLPAKDKFHIFLLIGQSNMAGRGAVADEDRRPHPRVLMLNKEGVWAPAIDPMHFDKPVAGVGLGRTFGIEIAGANPEITVGLVPCAVGGSPIDTWKPGAYYDATRSHPWDDAMRRAKLALKSGTLKGILWHQGESDSNSELAPGYETKLHDLIRRLRAELDAPDVPFIAGQMGRFADTPWNDPKKQVDKAHRELPARVPHTAFVSSEGLQHKGDKVHFDAASYREFGKRYARAWQKLTAAKHLKREIEGWTVWVNPVLFETNKAAIELALDLLAKQLAGIRRVVPAHHVAKLQEVPLWFNPPCEGARPKAEYHPDAGWLRRNGRDPAMARAVEFTNTAIWEREHRRMPMLVLHELAHAFHHRVIGHDHAGIQGAFAAAREGGGYESVKRWNGETFTTDRAYALSNEKEYFAEATEAFFGRNDFEPFTREELKEKDPRMFEVLQEIWK